MEFFNLIAISGILLEPPWIGYTALNEPSIYLKIGLGGDEESINMEVNIQAPCIVEDVRKVLSEFKKGVMVGVKGELRCLKHIYTNADGKWYNRVIVNDSTRHSCKVLEGTQLVATG